MVFDRVNFFCLKIVFVFVVCVGGLDIIFEILWRLLCLYLFLWVYLIYVLNIWMLNIWKVVVFLNILSNLF